MVALVSSGFTSGPELMVMLSFAPVAGFAAVAAGGEAWRAVFELFFSAPVLACGLDQKENVLAGGRIASVFLIVPASYTRSCTSRICVGCDRLLEGGLPKVAHEGCWPELPTRAEIAQPLPCSASSPTLRFSWNQELRLGRARKRKTLRE